MTARHRCVRCGAVYAKRRQLDDHWRYNCSDKARAEKEQREAARLRQVAMIQDRLETRTRERWPPDYGHMFGKTPLPLSDLLILEFTFGGLVPTVTDAPRLSEPGTIDARPGDDGTFTTE